MNGLFMAVVPVADGWISGASMFEAEPEILDGTWALRKIVPQQDDVSANASPLTRP